MSSGPFMSVDRALDFMRTHAHVIESLTVGQSIRHMEQETLANVAASAVELVHVFEQLDERFKKGGDLPSDWYRAAGT